MKKKFFTLALSALALTSMFVSCSESNNDPEPNANYAITLDLPLNQQNGTLSDTKATLTNVQTKQQYPANSFSKNGNVYVDSISVPQGLYNIEVTGKISYKVNGQNVVSMVKAKQENVNINLQAASNHNNNITMALNTFSAAQGFVLRFSLQEHKHLKERHIPMTSISVLPTTATKPFMPTDLPSFKPIFSVQTNRIIHLICSILQ